MKEQIEEMLRGLVAGIDVTSKALVDEGYITSITMVQLIGELDDAFDIEIAFEELTKENFSSVAAIEKMVECVRRKSDGTIEGGLPYGKVDMPYLRYRLACHAWWLVNATLFRWLPFFCYGWRRFLLCCFGSKIAKSARIGRTAAIDAPWNLEMGEGAVIDKNAWVSCHAPVVIGDRSVVSEGARILTGSHKTGSKGFESVASPVMIGDDCWIASCAILASGGFRELKIGNGAVVSAGAVVYSDVREKGIAIGNPAHCVLDRVLDKS